LKDFNSLFAAKQQKLDKRLQRKLVDEVGDDEMSSLFFYSDFFETSETPEICMGRKKSLIMKWTSGQSNEVH